MVGHPVCGCQRAPPRVATFLWNCGVAYFEKRGKDVVVMGPGGEKRFKHEDVTPGDGRGEQKARELMNKLRFLQKNNERNGGDRRHLYEAPIQVNTK